MGLEEYPHGNQSIRIIVAGALALAAVIALMILAYSPKGIHIPTFDELFPPPPPPLSVQERLNVLQGLASSSSKEDASPEERMAALEALRSSTSSAPQKSADEKKQLLQQMNTVQ